MKIRSFVATGVTITTLATSVPRAAHADDVAASPAYATGSPDVLQLTSRVLAERRFDAPLHSTLPLAGAPLGREIRLSSEAKTAIIIGAVVVGVLVIVGVVALGKPGKLRP